MQQAPARIGDPLDRIDTPALVVDLDAFERNLRKMAESARKAGVRLRPHAKTHRSTAVALKQMALGAAGQCCQKVGEAEALVRGGVRDVLVTNEVVSEGKLRRLAALAADATIGLCFDAAEPVALASRVAEEMGVRLDGVVEIEVGMQRCGVAPGAPAVALARRIAESPGLRFRGLQAYHGSAQHLPTHGEARSMKWRQLWWSCVSKVMCTNGRHFGRSGFRISFILTWCGRRLPFFVLHGMQEQTMFSHVVTPPLSLGTM
jgi:D-serine deaminase-like pyridoxal phosphate-dependent protein